jgi:hypothetical protein
MQDFISILMCVFPGLLWHYTTNNGFEKYFKYIKEKINE